MNECDTAMLAKQSGADLTIPCHFWTFSRHQGNPYLFEERHADDSARADCLCNGAGRNRRMG